MSVIIDKHSRVIDYLRISVTDRCNLRCIYCMPACGVDKVPHRRILSYEEIIRIVKISADLGVKKIRLTGGEPLIRKDIVSLVQAISQIKGIEDLSMTTNGILLKQYAKALIEAGLKRINISLDSLKPTRFAEITRGGNLHDVLQAIELCQTLEPIKINMVPIKGLNDDEIEDFARLTYDFNYHVRFIEFMPIGSRELWSKDKVLSTDEIKQRVGFLGNLKPVKIRKNGPARYYKLEGAKGVIGFISPITHHFCEDCNRLRITSDGKIRPCLFSESELDLKSAMMLGCTDEELERLLRLAVAIKPQRHNIDSLASFDNLKNMSKIGG